MFYLHNNHRKPDTFGKISLWGSAIHKNPPTVDYDHVMRPGDSGVAELSHKIVCKPVTLP